MPSIDSLRERSTDTWTYGLAGGVAAVPLTVALYLASGAGSELSLNAVPVGGLLAGYLAASAAPDADAGDAGFLAGLVGGLPGLWLFADLFRAAGALTGPLPFRVLAVAVMAVALGAMLFGLSGVLGLFGGKLGGWLAAKRADRGPTATGT